MRYIPLFSLILTSCSLPFLRKAPPPYEKVVVVISHDGKGLSAVLPDTAVKVLKISLLGDYGRSDFHFVKKVHFGVYDGSTASYVMDPKEVAVLETDVGQEVSEVSLKVHRMIKALKVPGEVELIEPVSNLPDWDNITVKWEGTSDMYVLRIYAFTMMTRKDELVLLDSTRYTFDLSPLYGNGFLSVMVCPLSGSRPGSNERIKVFTLGKCVSRTLIVGDTSVWEGETPEPPWNGDDVLWYLLMM